jgi:hypothetical protein
MILTVVLSLGHDVLISETLKAIKKKIAQKRKQPNLLYQHLPVHNILSETKYI